MQLSTTRSPLASRRPASRIPFRRAALAAAVALGAVLGSLGTALAASERQITDALIWTGMSTRVARNRLDREDHATIRRLEARIGGYPDGHLDGGELRALVAAARHARGREGYEVTIDPATGARIGLPTAWLARREATAEGSRWRSPDGAITIETFRRPGTLDDVERAERRGGTEVSYAAGRSGWRVLSGYAPDGRTVYVRAARGDGEVTGFRTIYESELAPRLDRVTVAMSSDFRGFSAPPTLDALAYAPREADRDETRRFRRVERPDFAILPPRGPRPAARPPREVATADRTMPPLELPRAEPRPGAVSSDPPRRSATDRPATDSPREGRRDSSRRVTRRDAPATSGPVTVLDDDETALAPPRPQGRPDTGQSETAVPRTVTGLITDEGQSCPTLRGSDGTLYALVGEVPGLVPGTLVTVETVGVDTEVCSAGRTVAVGGLRVLQSP